MLEIFCIIVLVWLGCLFPALLVDAIKAEGETAGNARYKAGACFGAILFLLVLILN